MLRFNKVHKRILNEDGVDVLCMDIYYSIGGDNGIAHIKNPIIDGKEEQYIQINEKNIRKDLRETIKKGYAIHKN